jgi:hypothetical protein
MLILEVSWDCIQSGVKSSDFMGYLILSRTDFQQPGQFQKAVTPKPPIISRCESNRWKDEKVFYNYCIGLLVRFQPCQFQIWCFLTAIHSQVRIDIGNWNFRLEVVSGFKYGFLHDISIGCYSPNPKLIIGWNLISLPCSKCPLWRISSPHNSNV